MISNSIHYLQGNLFSYIVTTKQAIAKSSDGARSQDNLPVTMHP